MQLRFGLLTILALGLLSGSSLQAQDILGWWLFDDNGGATAADSGGLNPGTLTDFHNTTANAGNGIGSSGWSSMGAINFDGRSHDNTVNGDTVRTTLSLSSLAGKSFTIEALVSSNYPQQNWSPFFGQSSTSCCFFFGRTDNAGSMNPVAPLHFNLAGLGSNNSIAVPIADGNQHHIALTFNDVTDRIDMFFDYQNVGSFGGVTGTLGLGDNTLWLGGVGHANGAERWDGYAWETRVMADTPGNPGSGVLPVEAFVPLDPNGIAGETPQGSSFNFASFGDTSRFMMRGTAGRYEAGTNNTPADDRIRLTTSTHGGQGGAAYLNGRVHFPQANLAFSTKFTVELSLPVVAEADGPGADGMTFVIQNVSPKALGWAGGGMGIQDIGQYVAVELDTWNGGLAELPGSNGSHIAILTNTGGTIAQNPTGPVGMPRFNDGGLKYVWVDYDGAQMQVYFNSVDVKPGSPHVTTTIDLAAHFGGAQDLYMGFTGATGGALNSHDVVNWQFSSVPEPSTYALACLGIAGLAFAKRRRRK